MNDGPGHFGGTWALLEGAERASGTRWRSTNLPVRADGRHLVLAVDDLRQRHLLVPLEGRDLPASPRSALSVRTREFEFNGVEGEPVQGRYLDIHCGVKTLNGQFDKVIADVVEAIGEAEDAAGAAAATVAAWRRLFSTLVESRSLTYQQRLALFGELSVLRDLVEVVPGFDTAWWTGPLRDPQDFRLPNGVIEVKTVGEDSAVVTVHGLEQLEPVDEHPVSLVIRKVVESPSGTTLSELFSQVLSSVEDRTTMRERAAMVGVTDTDPDPIRFDVAETLIGRVDDGFPRIRAADVVPSVQKVVGNVEYDLDVVRLRPHMTIGSLDEILEGK